MLRDRHLQNGFTTSAASVGTGLATLLLAGAAMLPAAALAQGSQPLVIARNIDLNSLDPHRAFCDTCQIYNSSAYQSLLTLDKDNNLVALLAATWESNEAQTEFTFALDPAATFSDGSPVEAADVKWSLERLKNVQGSAAFLMSSVSAIETPDARTVVLKTDKPNSELFNIMAAPYAAIVNSEVATAEASAVAGEDAATADNAEGWFLSNSAGSGPYVLASYEPNAELRLTANTKYWRPAPGIADVVIRQVKDAVAQAQMLESGSADIAMQIDADTAETMSTDAITVETVPSYNFIYLALSPGATGNQVPLTPQVREAISLAIDREGVLDFTLGDEGQLISAPIPLGFPGGAGFEPQAFDAEKAQALLTEAGHPDGFAIEAAFPNMNVYGVDLSLMMQKVQQDLSKVGIEATLQPIPFSNWRERIGGDGIPLTAVFYAPDFYGTSQYVEYFGMTEGGPWAKRAGAERDPSVLNPREAELYTQALAASGNEAAELWHQAGEEMIKDRVILPLVSPNLILAYGSAIKGVRYSACCNLPLAEITR